MLNQCLSPSRTPRTGWRPNVLPRWDSVIADLLFPAGMRWPGRWSGRLWRILLQGYIYSRLPRSWYSGRYPSRYPSRYSGRYPIRYPIRYPSRYPIASQNVDLDWVGVAPANRGNMIIIISWNKRVWAERVVGWSSVILSHPMEPSLVTTQNDFRSLTSFSWRDLTEFAVPMFL